jgi:hypothetical protein
MAMSQTQLVRAALQEVRRKKTMQFVLYKPAPSLPEGMFYTERKPECTETEFTETIEKRLMAAWESYENGNKSDAAIARNLSEAFYDFCERDPSEPMRKLRRAREATPTPA